MTATPPPSEPTTGARIIGQSCVRKHPDYERIACNICIDSALASQEARHRQEMEEAKRAIARIQASYDAGIRVRRQLEETIRGTDEAHAKTSRILGEQRARAEAAEQREREAGARITTLLTALTDLLALHRDCEGGHDHGGPLPCVECTALAALRSAPSPVHTGFDPAEGDDYTVKASFPVPAAPSPVKFCPCENPYCPGQHRDGRTAKIAAPSPVSAPPTETIQERYARMAKSSEFKRAYEGQSLGERIPIDGASPVEPGSDPPTAKGETGYYCDHEFVCRLCGFDCRFSVPGSDPQADQEACMRGSDGCQIKGRHSMCGTVLADPQEPETR